MGGLQSNIHITGAPLYGIEVDMLDADQNRVKVELLDARFLRFA